MKNLTRPLFFAGIVLVVCLSPAVLSANNGIRSFNHDTNPALLSAGPRQVFELGGGGEFAFGNSYFSVSDILSETLVIDLDDIADSTPDRGGRAAFTSRGEGHAVFHLRRFGVGFGLYSTTDNLSRFTVDKDLVELFAQGNVLGERYSGSAEMVQRSFNKTGIYGSYQWRQFIFGVKVGAFVPLIWTDSNTKTSFSFETNADGTIRGSYAVEGDIYTSLGEDGLVGVGVHIDLGMIRPDERGIPRYGASITGIPILPARPGYAIENEGLSGTFETKGILDPLLDDDDPFTTTEDDGDIDTRTLESGDRPDIYLPIAVGGFYRFTVPFVDVVPSGQMIFGAYPRLNAGVAVEGNFFPLNILSIGVGHRDFLYETVLGIRAPFRAFELGLQFRSAAPEPLGAFTMRGLGAGMYLAVGW
ncbi:MAG: hypothetical protein EA428_05405 [Spirochaetaceae bacterium]|nr:MAG: hypothetical protein EA428_05405 [Spirochaetaceae bacterium]